MNLGIQAVQPVDDAIDWLTRLLLPVMRYRIQKLGPEASGAFNFYRERLEASRVFLDYEIHLAKWICCQLPLLDELHEIGCGWGQLVFLLAWAGYDTTGFEIDQRRFFGATHFHNVLIQIDEERAGRARLRYEFFPPVDWPQGSRSLVVSTNIIVSNADRVEAQLIWALQRYRYAIVDLDHFCRARRASERGQLIEMIVQTGMRSIGSICERTGDGRFHLFESTSWRNTRLQE